MCDVMTRFIRCHARVLEGIHVTHTIVQSVTQSVLLRFALLWSAAVLERRTTPTSVSLRYLQYPSPSDERCERKSKPVLVCFV